MEDAADVFEYAGDAETVEYMLFDRHTSIYDTVNFLSGRLAAYENGTSYDYAFVLKETGKMIGTGGVFNAKNLPHSAEIGYILNKKYWGKGYAAEGMRAVIDFLFDTLRVHRVEAYHRKENPRSGRVMQKLGMTYEGTSVDAMFIKGEYRTIVRYAVINDKKDKNEP
jgi:ribosomal-protein-alanine N-acetyltransferase